MAPLRGVGGPLSGMSNNDIVGMMKNNMAAILGTPESVIEQMRAYASAGAEELMIAWWSLDDIEGLEVLAEHVMPYVAA